jgi:CheY-like chemotaxis protein
MERIEPIEILLVEDNPCDAELATRALRKAGLANKLLWLSGGAHALEYLFRRGAYVARDDAHPRLILLDLKMPHVDGFEVLRAVKSDERTRSIPVVVLSSSRDDGAVARSYALGVNSYLVKPLIFAALADLVRDAGFYWLALNRTVPR